MRLGRRALLLGAGGVAARARAADDAPPPGTPAPDWVAALRDRLGPHPWGGGLLRSYDTEGDGPFDRSHANTAYTYDNAVAGIALLAAGEVASARAIGDALAAAQARDRFYTDGRLRNAYAAGPVAATGPYPMPGWWDAAAGRWVEDAYQSGTATGVVAWAMLLWLHLHARTGEAGYRAAAARAADFVTRATRVTAGYAGGFLGWEPQAAPVGWVSTEHNIDLAAAFAWLGQAEAAAHARDFVARMWVPEAGRFLSGLGPDGAPFRHPAADANLWPSLLPDAPAEWRRARAWVAAHLGLRGPAGEGIDFDDDLDGIWLEGSAYVALTADGARRDALLATLRGATARDGLVHAASVPRLTTGLAVGAGQGADFVYLSRPHVAATAWAVLALRRANPFSPSWAVPG